MIDRSVKQLDCFSLFEVRLAQVISAETDAGHLLSRAPERSIGN
jgi:hypothetical protein